MGRVRSRRLSALDLVEVERDPIRRRRLPRGRKNPNPDGMRDEVKLVFKKRDVRLLEVYDEDLEESVYIYIAYKSDKVRGLADRLEELIAELLEHIGYKEADGGAG